MAGKFLINAILASGFVLLFLLSLRRLIRWLIRGQKQPYWDAHGKVVVITGASSGIGAELARQYAARGARLALCARRKEELEAVADECRKSGVVVFTQVADMSKTASCEAFINAVGQQFGGVIDSLVLNAGVSQGSSLEDIDRKDLGLYRTIMDVNYHGSVETTYFALPLLKRSKAAKIVVVSSIMGCIGSPQRTGYCASKWALHGFFESLRCEITPKYGIEITMICPAQVATDINRTRLGSGGKVMELDMKNAPNVMSVEEAAHKIIAATAAGLRQEDMTMQCTTARWARLLLPELLDVVVVRRLRAISKVRGKVH